MNGPVNVPGASAADLAKVKKIADDAATAAGEAKTAAENAGAAASNAQSVAGEAKTAANEAKTAAENAGATASNAQSVAGAAKTAANEAKTAAENAGAAASNAQSVASEAKTAANEAKTAAANNITKAKTATLTISDWAVGSDGRYAQTVDVAGVTTDTTKAIYVDVALDGSDLDADAAVLAAWAGPAANNVTQGSGTLTFYSYDIPAVNIPLNVGVAA